ncbi:MAG: hypothetical protein QOH57_784, partial [Mycobacterium sp.]|nr:hypothetical protein [Mycobacterium sp.]
PRKLNGVLERETNRMNARAAESAEHATVASV